MKYGTSSCPETVPVVVESAQLSTFFNPSNGCSLVAHITFSKLILEDVMGEEHQLN